MTPPKKRDKVKVKKVAGWAVILSTGIIRIACPGKSEAEFFAEQIGEEKVIPVTITYKSGNGR